MSLIYYRKDISERDQKLNRPSEDNAIYLLILTMTTCLTDRNVYV